VNRRSFVGVLMASLGTLAIDPQALLWKPAEGIADLPLVMPDAHLTLLQITTEMARRIGAEIQANYQPEIAKIGQYGMTHQRSVTMKLPAVVGAEGLEERLIRPACEAMIDTLKCSPIRAFGRLEMPTGCDEAVRVVHLPSGVAVRGLKTMAFVDNGCWDHILRCDVLYAA